MLIDSQPGGAKTRKTSDCQAVPTHGKEGAPRIPSRIRPMIAKNRIMAKPVRATVMLIRKKSLPIKSRGKKEMTMRKIPKPNVLRRKMAMRVKEKMPSQSRDV